MISFIKKPVHVVRALEFLKKSRDVCNGDWHAVHIPWGTLQICDI